MTKQTTPLYAVLIDADNIPAQHAQAILREITRYGEPALRRVYGDWSSPHLFAWRSSALDLGLVIHQDTAHTKNKNATDIGLVIDAMDILHSGRFDGFVLVSSDSDFTALANRIREQGLDVIGIGEAKAPASLRNVCNRFILIENLVTAEDCHSNKAQPCYIQENKINEASALFHAAMDKVAQDGDWYNLSLIGKHIRADRRDFDPRSYGKAKLSELATSLPQFKTRKQGLVLQIKRVN